MPSTIREQAVTLPYLIHAALPPEAAAALPLHLDPSRYQIAVHDNTLSLDDALENECPDLLLLHLDFVSPDEYANVIATFRRTCPVDGAPVLAIGTDIEDEKLLAVFRAGASDYIKLPADQGMLVLRMERLLAKLRARKASLPQPAYQASRCELQLSTEKNPWSFEIERARRYGTPLTVVEFEWEPPHDESAEQHARVLCERVDRKSRKSDRVMALSPHQLAVILPGATITHGRAAAVHLQRTVQAELQSILGDDASKRWRGARVLEMPCDYRGQGEDLIRLLRLQPLEKQVQPPSQPIAPRPR